MSRIAKIFLQVAIDIDLGTHIAAESFLIDYKVKWEKLDKVLRLYKREFRADMLTEYFDGWQSLSDKIYFHDKHLISFNKKNNEMFINSKTISRKFPKTLDEFLFYVLEDDIELVWKEEVWDKYFKK